MHEIVFFVKTDGAFLSVLGYIELVTCYSKHDTT